MAYYGYGKKKGYSSKTKKSKKNSFSAQLTDFARKMGQVNRGLQNPDSLISSSYNAGLEKRDKKPKKTLF